MVLVNTNKMLKDALKNQYAVGHFNTSNLEFTQSIIKAAEITNSPVIIATSKSSINYAGYEPLSCIVKSLAKKSKVPVALHLDHSPDYEHVKNCVRHGWTSVMRDASILPFEDNIKETIKVTRYCRPKKVSVEAELGQLKGEEGWVKADKSSFTDPSQAKFFVEKTKCDSLAVSIGTSHGANKFTSKPHLDLNRLSEISDLVNIPLVLHGASEVPLKLIKKCNKFGANISVDSKGVPIRQIKAAIRRGICKVNTDTDLRLSFTASLRSKLSVDNSEFNPREILGFVREELTKYITKRMDVLGSSGNA